MSITVEPVRSGRELHAFVTLPWRLYRHDPQWIPPLIGDTKKLFDPRHNPFFEHGDIRPYLARRDGRVAVCVGCHGVDARGNQILGAANLTDADWLHGSTDADIRDVLMKGRSNQMPAFGEMLGAGKVHLLAAYVWGLSNGPGAPGPAR